MKLFLASLAVIAIVPAIASAQVARPLPSDLKNDRAALHRDSGALRAAVRQVHRDARLAAESVPADRTALAAARLQLRIDAQKLHQDAQPIIRKDEVSLLATLVQLHADQVAGNVAAQGGDRQAVRAARVQLAADMTATGIARNVRAGLWTR